MSCVLEIALTGQPTEVAAFQKWSDAMLAKSCAALPGMSALDVYRPIEGTDDPYNKDDGPPLLLVKAEFPDAAHLGKGVPALEDALASLPAGVAATMTAMERRHYPVAGEAAAGPLRAPFSYVVRYRRPAEDEAAFVAHYVDGHPQMEASFPRIRSVMCYFPLPRQPSQRFAAADYMLGNEVVFDSIEDFNAAMQSPVRHEMRAHFHSFPKFSGAVTHFAMLRERLLPA